MRARRNPSVGEGGSRQFAPLQWAARAAGEALAPLGPALSRSGEQIAARLAALALPALRLTVLVWVIFLASIAIYYGLYRYFLPRFLINEPVHFDFDAPTPSARVQLLLPNDHSAGYIAPGHYGQSVNNRFLRSGSVYSFSLRFRVSRTHRNQDIGKFMSRVAIVDRSGRVVARANRPVIVPYRSLPVRVADQMLRWPLYLSGLAAEEDEVQVDMVAKFREGDAENSASQLVEVNISRPDVDISACDITIYPELSYFTYFLIHFPFVSFSFGVMISFWGILLSVGTYVAISIFVRAVRRIDLSLDDDAEELLGSASTASTPAVGSDTAGDAADEDVDASGGSGGRGGGGSGEEQEGQLDEVLSSAGEGSQSRRTDEAEVEVELNDISTSESSLCVEVSVAASVPASGNDDSGATGTGLRRRHVNDAGSDDPSG